MIDDVCKTNLHIVKKNAKKKNHNRAHQGNKYKKEWRRIYGRNIALKWQRCAEKWMWNTSDNGFTIHTGYNGSLWREKIVEVVCFFCEINPKTYWSGYLNIWSIIWPMVSVIHKIEVKSLVIN